MILNYSLKFTIKHILKIHLFAIIVVNILKNRYGRS
jgi:hypothetical protein